jgi:hypothetical protein
MDGAGAARRGSIFAFSGEGCRNDEFGLAFRHQKDASYQTFFQLVSNQLGFNSLPASLVAWHFAPIILNRH